LFRQVTSYHKIGPCSVLKTGSTISFKS